ncbi:HTH-type transcriptional regulator MalT [Acerihabitans arboris]|uniref:HTH-type transcriptional regulator MalT n=1 Tax=Acerihabitans arboris TaxID=2691583 RepID=A0A845SIR4_9GAMM|nr:HTH-type transcriptional regulator MalT [Acerihabitans arboris]NDL63829.1 HTH-type transcriptional regulator MalT [Acerihabitans arboris]
MLIPSKLRRPARLHNTVPRQRLLDRLSSAANYRLALITSPAGYGKTTLIAQWAAARQDLGWFSLDESDNEPEIFANYLVAAIQQATDGHCLRSEALAQKHQYASLATLFAQLSVDLADWDKPLFLVIDDYHLITNSVIHDAMRGLLRQQPDNLKLVLLSRNLPSLGIANLRVRDQLLEIGSQQLAFTHEEAKLFFDCRLDMSIESQDSNRLCDEVAGWATALQLIVLSTRQSDTPASKTARRLSGINAGHLSDYLVDEVLDRVDGATRRFLLRCSLLRSMNDVLIDRLTGEENGQQRLEQTEHQGLFIQRMDDSGEWFRFHPLFAGFLRQRCQWELAAELPEIHRSAAAGWLELGYPGEAIHHAMAADDVEMMCRILLDSGWTLFNHGELALLDRCLKHLPYDVLILRPRLVLLKGWLAQSQHRCAEVASLLAHDKAEMARRKLDVSPWLAAEFNALLAQVAINTGKPDEAEALAAEALRFLPQCNYFGRIVATSVTGEVAHCKGQLTIALTMMQQTDRMARQHGVYHYALWALLQQSEILIAQGYLQAAFEIQDKAFELVGEQHLEQLPMHEFLLRLRAQLLWSWSRLDEAEQAALAGLKVLAGAEPQQQLQCLAMLAKIALARGDFDNARSHLHRCENLMSGAQYHSDWVTNADKPRVLFWQLTGDTDAAARWLGQTVKPDNVDNHFLQGQWRNIARAQILLGQFDEAEVVLDELNDNARQLRLVSDLNRNLLLNNLIYWHAGRKNDAQKVLMEALSLANRTGFISHFVIEGETMAVQLRQLLQLGVLPELEQQRTRRILRDINAHHRHKFAHFDEDFVQQLLHHPQVPELIRISPLTQREWQVLGLIYSGYSNNQIAGELEVAATTIKTHIRNLYQKLGVGQRQDAVQQVKKMLTMIGYAV